jgi:hypothetical protein
MVGVLRTRPRRALERMRVKIVKDERATPKRFSNAIGRDCLLCQIS